MAEELGAAVLRVTVDTRLATQALEAFRTQVSQQLGDLSQINFRGLEQGAAQAGQRTGRALAQGINQATQGLNFESIREALDFSGALNGTLRDLRQYQTALVALREITPATAQGFGVLNDVIAATSQAIRNYTASTDSLRDDAARVAIREQTEALRQQRNEVAAAAQEDRAWAQAIRTIEQAQRSATAATREATAAARQQLQAYLDLAKTGVGAVSGVAGTAGAVGRGAVGAVKTGVKVGKAAYGIGAELGIFEDPKPGKITAALKALTDRLKFLGEQATTTRGFLLRLFEAGGVTAIAQYRDQIKNVIDLISGTTGAAKTATGAVGNLRELLNNNWLLGNGNTLIGKALNAIAPATDAINATTGALDSLTRTGGNAFLDALKGVDQFGDAIAGLDPRIQAAVIALGGLSVAFREKPIVEGLSTVTEYLENLRTTALQVSGDLDRVLSRELQSSGLTPAEREQKARNAEILRQRRNAILQAREIEQRLLNAPLALPSSELLQQRLQRDGQAQPQRLSPGLNTTTEQAVQALQRQVVAAQNVAKAEGEAQAAQTGLNAALEAGLRVLSATVNVIDEQVQGYRFQKEQLQDIIELQKQRRAQEAQASAEARQRLIREAATRDSVAQFRSDRLQQQRADDFERRLAAAQERRAAEQARNQRAREAGSNALIGGAFPLLFGQGIGASLGGAAGGAAGGLLGGQFGFGLSLLGTAVGAAVDTLRQRFTDLTKALEDPINNIGVLAEQFVFANRAQERYVKTLIETGQTAQATLEIQKESAQSIDPATAALSAAANDRYSRSLSNVLDILGNIVSGPATGFINFLDAVLQRLGGAATGGSQPSITGPRVITDARNSLGRNVGGAIAGGLLVAGGIAALATGAGAPIGVGLIGSGLTMAGIGGFGAANDIQKERVASSQIVAQGEKLITAELAKQVELQRKQLEAKAAGNEVSSQMANFAQQESQAVAAFLQESQRINIDSAAGNITASQAGEQQNRALEALKMQQAQIKVNRDEYQKGLAAAAAAAERDLANTRQLIGLEGERLSIRQEQQQVAQAESEFAKVDATFRKEYGGVSPNTLSGSELESYKAAYNFREAAEARLEQTRITALERIRRAEEAIADQRRSVEERISNARAGAGLTGLGRGVLADQSAFRQEQINAARVQQRAKENPGNVQLAEQARDARRSLVAAGEELKLKLQDAFKAAQAAVRNITRSIEDAKLNLAQLRGGTGGVNQFLSPEQVNARAAAVAPQLESETKKLAQQLGVIPRFFGSQAQRNDQMAEFIRAARQELRAPEDIAQLNQDLIAANNDLAAVTKALISSNASVQQSMSSLGTQIAELVAKQWNVDVTVTGGAAAIKTF